MQESDNTNQEIEPQNELNKSENSVKRGRPKGSSNKPKILDYVTPGEVEELLIEAKKQAKEGKSELLKFLLEQIFGKARQNIGLDGGEDGSGVTVIFDNAFTSKTERDSN